MLDVFLWIGLLLITGLCCICCPWLKVKHCSKASGGPGTGVDGQAVAAEIEMAGSTDKAVEYSAVQVDGNPGTIKTKKATGCTDSPKVIAIKVAAGEFLLLFCKPA